MKYLILILLCLIYFFSSCKKNNELKKPQPVYLRDKSLSEIKAEVQGNWKIHYKYGGITGTTKTQLENSTFKVVPNDSIYLTLNNMPVSSEIATFRRLRTEFGYNAYTMNFILFGGTPYQWIVDLKIGDTLGLSDNFPNGEIYMMTKIP